MSHRRFVWVGPTASPPSMYNSVALSHVGGRVNTSRGGNSEASTARGFVSTVVSVLSGTMVTR